METKKTVILVVVYLAVLAVCVVMTGVGKHHDVKTGIRTHLSANEITTCENRVSAMPDDPEYGKFDCVLAEDDNNIIALYTEKEDSDEVCKVSVVGYKKECRSDPVETSIAGHAGKVLYSNKAVPCPTGKSVPVTDFLVSEDKMRILMVYGTFLTLYEKKLVDNKYDFIDLQFVYIIHWLPFLFNGHLTQAVFITPDIIRVSNTVGAVMHYRIDHRKANYVKDQNGKVIGMPDMTEEEFVERKKIPAPYVTLVWWNGVGSKRAATGLGPGDGCEISSTEPIYPGAGFDGWTRMDQKTRTAMQERVEEYAVAQRIPREVLLKNDGKVISLKKYPDHELGEQLVEFIY